MSDLEINIAIIGAVILLGVLIVPILLLISSNFKKWFDESTGNDSGIWGWIISIIIGLVILYALANYDNISVFDPRHG